MAAAMAGKPLLHLEDKKKPKGREKKVITQQFH